MRDAALVIMAKRPAGGQTKSRLSPALSAREAAALYEALLRDTIQLAAGLVGIQLVIAITPPDALDYFRRISPPGTHLLPVAGADIGECLDQALSRLFAEGYTKALALNSDGPTLPIAHLRRALNELERRGTDVVLGPSEDGGYYLIGLKRPHPALFRGVAWSTERVARQTLARAKAIDLEVVQLPSWYDVDTEADLKRLLDELPTLPDDALPHTRRWLRDWQRPESHKDGQRLLSVFAVVLTCLPGMNLGFVPWLLLYACSLRYVAGVSLYPFRKRVQWLARQPRSTPHRGARIRASGPKCTRADCSGQDR